MFSTFSYKDGTILIASKLWSDFASHLPLIRSFSYGANFPVEYPLFPNEPIRYHFLFYALVGLLERVGVRIDIALNVLSAASFVSLMCFLYLVAKRLFQNRATAVLAVVFFLFNPSLSFVNFFRQHPLSWNTLNDILTNSKFPSFGPYDGSSIAAFWNLNIYTNQRHLALSYFLVLLLIYILYPKWHFKRMAINAAFVFIIFSILLLINHATFAIAALFLGWFFLLNPKKNVVMLFPAAFSSLLIFLFPKFLSNSSSLHIKIGFLLSNPTIFSFIGYWFVNFGLLFVLLPLALIIAPTAARKLFAPLLLLFIIPNILQFSPDIINNHKFFNFFLILSGMYIAHAIVKIWKRGNFKTLHIHRVLAIVFCIALTLSGIIDFFVIKNDYKIPLADIPKNKDAKFILENSHARAIFLNSTSLYHPASLAGRPIFYGYSYFPWSYGYDTKKREDIVLSTYRSKTKQEACKLLRENKISFVELSSKPDENIQPNRKLWEENFVSLYQNKESGIAFFDVKASCKTL